MIFWNRCFQTQKRINKQQKQMNKIQIQIVQIENGWLVNSPPSLEQIQSEQQAGRQPQPTMFFCSDYNDLCSHLKSIWPVT